MLKRALFMLLIPAVALLTIAQTFPPGMRNPKWGPRIDSQSRSPQGVSAVFYVRGKEYQSVLPAIQVKSASTWSPLSPLPFNLGRAEKKARIELAKVVSDADSWQVSDFQVIRFRFAGENAWFMQVGFEPVEPMFSDSLPLDSFTVFLDFDGKPGQISRVEQ